MGLMIKNNQYTLQLTFNCLRIKTIKKRAVKYKNNNKIDFDFCICFNQFQMCLTIAVIIKVSVKSFIIAHTPLALILMKSYAKMSLLRPINLVL